MIFHLVSGDSLAEGLASIRVAGEVIVCRECLVDGPVDFPDLDSLFDARALFIGDSFGAPPEEYRVRVVSEFRRLETLGPNDELNLWFGDDLFCQVNLWFSLSLMQSVDCAMFRVFPEGIDFGDQSAGALTRALEGRRRLSPADRALACDLWTAYRKRDREHLAMLSKSVAGGFRRFGEMIGAAIEIDSRPKAAVAALKSEFGDDFRAIFHEFSRREAIYGFGDSQVRARLCDAEPRTK